MCLIYLGILEVERHVSGRGFAVSGCMRLIGAVGNLTREFFEFKKFSRFILMLSVEVRGNYLAYYSHNCVKAPEDLFSFS